MGRGQKKVSDLILLEVYERRKNIWTVAKELGMCGQSVHERLVKMGKMKRINVFTDKERSVLLEKYQTYKNIGKLNDLAKTLGRTKQFMCRQAKALGLTNQKSPKPYAEKEGSNPYNKYHARVRSLRGAPKMCEACGEDRPLKQYDWANMTGEYENPNDYKRLCKKCHRKYDKNRPTLAHKPKHTSK